ncbi:conserved hypothetical protein [Theileria orientalis strain Shintoku]|uniref:Uncharacterized protein n=1 Tax=Theileria orientalis strain Shintoku TaxID=869250 RepID=J4CD88_THEOR|nr:conserved hypothetical protein [Theileria orientalis strain Shintoku]BAM40717.1 conserved hypothetical protein [Theileria orientalis strain Shintoku]|eukprot:XP_009691018.1 conserved hypothetical protein [Theileria orientalis strain Shintoku]
MDVVVPVGDNGRSPCPSGSAKCRASLSSFLNKCLFFLVGSSVTCIASTGRLTSKAFDTPFFISDCFSVFVYVNLAAFLFVLLLIECSYLKAVVSGWLCLAVHLSITFIVSFASGDVGRYLYTSMFAAIGVLEALVIQSNSFVVSNFYSSSIFSNLYSGYYGGLAIFSLIQTLVQLVVGTNNQHQARLCLIITHGSFTFIVFCTIVAQTVIYSNTRYFRSASLPRAKFGASCVKKLRGMYRIFRSVPKYSPRFIVFILSDLCKCAFFQVFIPYRMLLNDKQVTVVFFVDNLCDLLGRSIASSADDTVVSKGPVLNHRKFLFKRNLLFIAVPLICWIASSFFVWATWTLSVRFFVLFVPILIAAIVICFALGYCSTRGMNGCIPILDYFSQQFDDQGSPMFPDEDKHYYSYVNDLNTFFIKFLWVIVFAIVSYLATLLERHQETSFYRGLRDSLLG